MTKTFLRPLISENTYNYKSKEASVVSIFEGRKSQEELFSLSKQISFNVEEKSIEISFGILSTRNIKVRGPKEQAHGLFPKYHRKGGVGIAGKVRGWGVTFFQCWQPLNPIAMT